MILPPSRSGVAFSEAADGDLRGDSAARERASQQMGIPFSWATSRQVHGAEVAYVEAPIDVGEADAMWTTIPDLPLAVFTADCYGLVLHAPGAVGVAHAGWRGADAGVVAGLREEMRQAGHEPGRAEIGPGIGPCCFEVGPEVAEKFEEWPARTSWDTRSVDLRAAIAAQLEGIDTWAEPGCTQHEDRWLSHRRNGTTERMATIGWLS